jgi:ATP-binding cassette subfamily F protein 3
MVAFLQVCRHYGTQDVLTDISCQIPEGRKIGLIGANGAGKTTFIRLLTGDEEPSSGSIVTTPGTRIGLVPQHVEAEPGLVVESYLLQAYAAAARGLREQEDRLAAAPPEAGAAALHAYQKARDAFDATGGDDAPRRAASVLAGLGLEGVLRRDIGSLSGGERNVLSLAKALAARPTLLVLDEPGNHLDFAGLAWLERFLQEFDGAILIVSHNRYLLDRVADRIFEIERTRLTVYEGNYSAYRMSRLRTLVTQQADFTANQKRLAELEALVARFAQFARATGDPAWGRRLHARKTQLAKAREQAVEQPHLDLRRISIAVDVEQTRADIALQVNAYAKGFADKILFEEASLQIACGERVALVGPNGCGKSTFLRDVVERSSWDGRQLRIGPSLTIGYCAQHQETLDPSKTVLDQFLIHGDFTRKEVFAALARLLFAWEDLDKMVGDLSGGEQNRLQLALIMIRKANFLILDEPTNHMDILSREAIEESLGSFPGTILLVSHDRYLLDRIATTIVLVEDRGFTTFHGSFSEFWASRGASFGRAAGRIETRRAQVQRAQRGRTDADRARTDRAGAARIAELEARIATLEAEKRSLEEQISAAYTKGDHQQGRKLASRLERVSGMLAKGYADWEQAAE